jgi:uncharacterized protein YaiE (UPF0345 family)
VGGIPRIALRCGPGGSHAGCFDDRQLTDRLLIGSSMKQFENVTVVKAANIYFDGKVTSRSVLFADGSKKTLGIMLPGDYEFGADQKETMEILSGKLDVQLPGTTEWKAFTGGTSFVVPAGTRFKLKVQTITDYCCSYE